MPKQRSLLASLPEGRAAPEDAGAEAAPLPGWRGWVLQRVPAVDSLRTYSWRALGRDLTAGLTVATVAVPQAMAYATLAGVPPQYGLFTAIVMTGVGALLDSSRQLINGPTNAISIALLSALALVPEEMRVASAVQLAFLVGAVQLGIALLRLGDLTRYVSHSVIVGFTVGAGLLLVLDQMKNLLGLRAHGHAEDHFLKRFWLTMSEGGPVHLPTALIAAGTVAVVLAVRAFNGWRRARGARFPIPQHLVAVILMAVLIWAFRWDQTHGVTIVGPIPAALPRLEAPQLGWEPIQRQAGNAFAIAILGLLEAVAMAKAIAVRTGQKLDINQQCLSEGAANLAGSFFQCIPGSGSLTRSAVNQQAGAVSQWSGVFSAAAVAGTVLLFAPLAQYIPRASLAGLLMLAAFRMVDREQLVFHLRATRLDTGVVLATALAAVLISVEFCILIGVFLSFVLYVPRAAKVRLAPVTVSLEHGVREHRSGDPSDDRLLGYALEGEMFFGAEPEIAKLFDALVQKAREPVRVVLLCLRRARNPDAGFLAQLRNFHDRLRRRGIALVLCDVHRDMARALANTGLDAAIGAANMFRDSGGHEGAGLDAVRRALERAGVRPDALVPEQPENGSPVRPVRDGV